MKKLICVLLVLGCGSLQAALVDRGGGFIYDDVLDITWMQDGNITGIDSWDRQVAWADGLSLYDTVRDVTWSDWRLPTTLQPDASCDTQYDPGNGVPVRSMGTGCTGSEMGHLFNVDGVSASSPGLFTNVQSDIYWSGTEYAPDTTMAWDVFFSLGLQNASVKCSTPGFAWAVHDGNPGNAVVPVPAAVWLFGSALGLLGWLRRRRVN